MRRDYLSAQGSSEDSETTERTGLVRHSSYLGQYPYFGSSSDRFDGSRDDNTTGAVLREENMTEYYRQTFTTSGVSIGVRDVTQIRRHRLQQYCPRVFAPRVECESVSAFLSGGHVHAIVDAEGTAAVSLVKAIAGETTCYSGEIVTSGDGGFNSGPPFRRIVGVVSRSSAAAMPSLSVSRNLRFVLDMRTRGNQDWKRLMIQSMTAFVSVRPHVKARDLDLVEEFGLRLAMELVLDPSVVIVFFPFEGLDFVSRTRVAGLLRRVATILRKTVIVTSSSLGPYLFDIAESTLLFGGGGRALYSGPSKGLVQYFNDLRIPRHRHHRDDDGEDSDDESVALDTNGCRRHRSPVYGCASGFGPHAALELPDRVGDREQVKSSTTTDNNQSSVRETETDDEGPSRPFESPTRISSRLFSDKQGTPVMHITSKTKRMTTPRRTVRVSSGEDALDLAVEWAESEAQTMYYAAKFYDSPTHRAIVEAIDELSGGSGMGGIGQNRAVQRVAEPQRALWKPIVLCSYFAHQTFADTELVLGTIGLLIAVLTVSVLMHFQSQDQGGMYNIRGILFLLFSLVLITNEATMGSVSGQLRLFFHQRNSGLYGTVCFVFCLTIQVVMVRALYVLLLVPFVLTVVQATKGVIALVGVVSVVHALLLYTLYALVPSRRFAGWAAHAYFGFSLMCSGFLLNLRTMPSFFGCASVVRWGYGPALKERLTGKEFSCDGAGNTSYCYTGEEYLAIEGFMHDSFGFSVFALCVMGGISLIVFATTLAVR